jgi:hypothetical protein
VAIPPGSLGATGFFVILLIIAGIAFAPRRKGRRK